MGAMTRSGKEWTLAEENTKATQLIGDALGLDPILSRLLVNRGVSTPEEAERFLNPRLDSISSPFDIPSMDLAANRVALAQERGEKVAVYGDFDVDGLTAAATLSRFLLESGIDTQAVASRRQAQTRGLTPEEIDQMKNDGCALVITVDTGSSAVAAAHRAGEVGLDLVITDHHLPSGQRPQALAEVNPHFCEKDAPGRDLSGVGVAFKLAMAARKTMRNDSAPQDQPNLKRLMGLVALGTVADCSPLVGENRTLVRHGLDELSNNGVALPGLEALKQVCRLNGRAVTSRDISFDLAPRLNSASRMNNVQTALDLLTTTDPRLATRLAATLDADNNKRKLIQNQILEEARAMTEKLTERETGAALVLRGEEWNPGVIGIVASRLVDLWNVPVVMVSFSGGMGKGSCRSTPAFDMHSALLQTGDTLDRFGGHKGAAGLYVSEGNFELFKEKFLQVARTAMESTTYGPRLLVDMLLNPDALPEETVRRMTLLEPFGDSMEPPLFMGKGLRLLAPPEFMGDEGRSVRFSVAGVGGPVQAVAFGMGDYFREFDWKNQEVDLAYTPEINRWGSMERLQLRVVDIRRPSGR